MKLSALTRVLAALCLATTAWGGAPQGQSDVHDLLAMLEGTYRSPGVEQAAVADDPLLSDRHVRVSAPALGDNVMYWQLNSGAEQKVYRQRILVFEPGDVPGTVKQLTWSLAAAERYVNGWDRPELFEPLQPSDLVGDLPADCAQTWQRRDDGWYGRVDPQLCRIWSERRQAWRRIEGEAFVTPGSYLTAERGFDDAGKQVFGSAPGEYYELQRR